MAPKIHCVRHGQGLHNVGAGFYNLPDPMLTPEGEAQCVALRTANFSEQSSISLIAASPMVRAIQSAVIVFQSIPQAKMPPKTILAVPDAQETSTDPCDIGSDPNILKQVCEEKGWQVDLSLVKEGWNDKKLGSRYSPSSRAIGSRARDLRLFLRKQARDLALAGDQDVNIVLVAHGGFLHYFTGDWEDADKRPGTGWVNCETRSYVFEHGTSSDDDKDALLVETADSRQQRGLKHPMFPQEKQKELYESALQSWENQGLQNHHKLDLEEQLACA